MSAEPIWRRVERCAKKLAAEGRIPFTRADLVAGVQAEDPTIGEGSINPVIQGVTDNLRGGAPGAVGKDILHSVARGRFVLLGDRKADDRASDLSKATGGQPDAGLDPSLPKSEAELRDRLIGMLRTALPGLQFAPEGVVDYQLPSGRLVSHKSDILVSASGSTKLVSIEVKYKSAVTDQFKARAYDARHMKREHGGSILTVLLFAKAGTGISVDRARDFSYEFDRFYGDGVQAFLKPDGVRELGREMEQFFTSP